MADRRAISKFSRVNEIDDLLDRRGGPGLSASNCMSQAGGPIGHYTQVIQTVRPYGPEWTGSGWGGDLVGGPSFVVPLGVIPSNSGRFSAAKRVDGAWVIQAAGLGALTVTIVGPNSSSVGITAFAGIVGASVKLVMSSGLTFGPLLADGMGQVTFHGVPAGIGTLTATATGWNAGSWSVTTANNNAGQTAITGGTAFSLTPTSIPNPIVITVFSASSPGPGLFTAWMAGVPVTIKDPLGATVFSGATNASGQVSYTPVATGTFSVSATPGGRFTGTTSASFLVNGSGSCQVGLRLVADTTGINYVHVFGTCAQPIKTSLTITDSLTGSLTAPWDRFSGSWHNILEYNYPGAADGSCQPASGVGLTYVFYWILGKPNLDIYLAQSNTLLQSNNFGGGGSAGGNGCPTSGFTNQVRLQTRIVGNFAVTCPTSFSATLTLPANYTKRCDSSFKKLYGDALPTYTITESP